MPELRQRQIKRLMRVHEMTRAEVLEIVEDFNAMDKNGDGEIHWKEFRKAKGMSDKKKEKFEKLFKEYDKDGSGKITFAEFFNMEEDDEDV